MPIRFSKYFDAESFKLFKTMLDPERIFYGIFSSEEFLNLDLLIYSFFKDSFIKYNVFCVVFLSFVELDTKKELFIRLF